MALGCLRDDATTTNDNSKRRCHRILSACGGFLFSRKSVARGALHPFFAKTPHFPLNQIKLPLRRSLATWRSPYRLVYDKKVGAKVLQRQSPSFTWRNHRLPSPTRINLPGGTHQGGQPNQDKFVPPSVCESVCKG